MTQNPFEALGGGEPGGFDLRACSQQAQQMQEQLESAQERLAEARVEGTVGGGAVTVTVNGIGELQAVTIKAGRLRRLQRRRPADLGDLIVAAYRDAKAQADALAASALGPLAGGVPACRGSAVTTPRPARLRRLSGPPCTKASSRTSSTSSAGCPASVPRAPSGSRSTCSRPSPPTYAGSPRCCSRSRQRVRFCSICFNVSEDDQCRICRDPRRDQTVLCVVEEYKDVVAIERTREFRGRYHVLGGAISPIDGIGPDQLHIASCCTRLADGAITEVILATDPNLEGEATATYLTRMLKTSGTTHHPSRERAPRRRRPGVRRRGHARAGVRREADRPNDRTDDDGPDPGRADPRCRRSSRPTSSPPRSPTRSRAS